MPGILTNILGIIENWGKCSEMMAVKLPDITSRSITFEIILPIRVLEWLVIIQSVTKCSGDFKKCV